jgi:hypothetical protein
VQVAGRPLAIADSAAAAHHAGVRSGLVRRRRGTPAGPIEVWSRYRPRRDFGRRRARRTAERMLAAASPGAVVTSVRYLGRNRPGRERPYHYLIDYV